MEIKYNCIEKIKTDFNDLTKDDFGLCKCGKCDRIFLQKRTIIKLFEDFIKKYNHLPISIDFESMKTEEGFMIIDVTIEQTKKILKKELQNGLIDGEKK